MVQSGMTEISNENGYFEGTVIFCGNKIVANYFRRKAFG